MASVVIDSTVISASGEVADGIAGEAILPGYPVCLHSDNKFYNANSASNENSHVRGIALSRTEWGVKARNERLTVGICPCDVSYGSGTLSSGALYSAARANGLAPMEDMIVDDYPSLAGYAINTSTLRLLCRSGLHIGQKIASTPSGDVAVTKCEIRSDSLQIANSQIRLVIAQAGFLHGEVLAPTLLDGFYRYAKASAAQLIEYSNLSGVALALAGASGAGNRVAVLNAARHLPGRIEIDLGATLAAGCVYVLSGTSGQIAPYRDLTAAQYPTILGWGNSDGYLEWWACGLGVPLARDVITSSSSSSSSASA
jgi:hypothetical protein